MDKQPQDSYRGCKLNVMPLIILKWPSISLFQATHPLPHSKENYWELGQHYPMLVDNNHLLPPVKTLSTYLSPMFDADALILLCRSPY